MTGFTFFQNYYEAISDEENGLTEEDQGRFYNAIFSYMFNDEDPSLKGACKLAFNLIKPSLDLSKTRSNAKNKNQSTEEKNQTKTKTEQSEIKPQSSKTKQESNENQTKTKTKQSEIKPELSPFFENKEQEERSKNNCSFVLSAGAQESDGVIGFLKENPCVINDVWDISELSFVDFSVLSQKIRESEFLKKTKSLSWLIGHYREIVADKYRDYEKRRRSANPSRDQSEFLADLYRQAEEEDMENAKKNSG